MSTKRCPFCKEELPESATFCPACFCELCKANAPTTVKYSNVKRIVISGICIVIALILLLIVILLHASENAQTTPTNTVQTIGFETPSPYITTAPVASETGNPLSTSAITTTGFTPTFTLGPSPILQITTPLASTPTATSILTEAPTSTPTSTPTRTPTSTPTSTPTIVPTELPTATPEPVENLWSYTISSNQATIKTYYGTDETVMIPEILNGAPVCEIASRTFFDNNFIQEVHIPDSVQKIGDYSFSNCDNLKTVYMEDSVTTLGTEAFSRNNNLQTVRLSNKIKTIPSSCFANCEKLQTINMPTSLTTILSSALDNTAITRLSLPASIATLPNMFCSYMPKLEEIQVASGNALYWSQDGVLFKKNLWNNYSTLIVYPGGKKDVSYTLPTTTDNVYSNAFCQNPYLQSVTLSPQTTYVNSYAFSGCTKLTSLVTYVTLNTIQAGAFRDCHNLTLTVTEGSYAHTYAIDNNIPYILK